MLVVDDRDFFLDSFGFGNDYLRADSEGYTMRKVVAKRCDGFLLVFSLTDRESLEKLKLHHELIINATETITFPAVILGNKCDDEKGRVVHRHGTFLSFL